MIASNVRRWQLLPNAIVFYSVMYACLVRTRTVKSTAHKVVYIFCIRTKSKVIHGSLYPARRPTVILMYMQKRSLEINYDSITIPHQIELTPTHMLMPAALDFQLPHCTHQLSRPILHSPSLGPFNIAVHPTWAPYGAERFLKMVEIKFFSSQIAMFRALKNFLVQVRSFLLFTVIENWLNSDIDLHDWGDA
jgi:hypothetical protein